MQHTNKTVRLVNSKDFCIQQCSRCNTTHNAHVKMANSLHFNSEASSSLLSVSSHRVGGARRRTQLVTMFNNNAGFRSLTHERNICHTCAYCNSPYCVLNDSKIIKNYSEKPNNIGFFVLFQNDNKHT